MLNQVGLPVSLFGEEGRTGALGFDWYAIIANQQNEWIECYLENGPKKICILIGLKSCFF